MLLSLIVKFLVLSNEMQFHDVISKFSDFVSFFKPKNLPIRAEILEKGLVQTHSCRRVTALLTSDEDVLFFEAPTT